MEGIEIFNSIKNSFGSLWGYKVRENSIEIITPYSTTTDKFISLFVKMVEGEYVVSDGGWLSDGIYDTNIDIEDECYLKLYFHYESHFEVRTVEDTTGKRHFYKKTRNPATISNIVYDLANFVCAVASASLVQFQDLEDKNEREHFQKEANAFINSITHSEEVIFQKSIGEHLKNIRFSAILKRPRHKLTLISYITGSTSNYFLGSIAKANMNFEIAEKSFYKDTIERKIAFVNDVAPGFQESKLFEYLNALQDQVNTPIIKWSNRTVFSEYV